MFKRRLTPSFLAVLGLLAMTSPLATDMYLASFTQIAADMATSASNVQLTLTTFLFGIGLGQLFFGPLSDRYGRRPVLLTALVALALDSLALIFVPSISLFIVLRFIQGFTGAAGVVLSRAIAVDISEGAAAVRALSLIATLVGLGPLIAPVIGGFVSQSAGWRAVLAVLAGITVVMLVLTTFLIPETLPPSRRHTGSPLTTFAAAFRLLRDRVFTGYVITFSMGFGALMSYIAASPFVGQVVLGMDQVQYGLAFAAGAVAMIIGNLVNARVATTVGPRRMQAVGVSLALAAGLSMLTLTLTGTLTIPGFILSAFLLSGGVSLIMSNSSALALARAQHARGSGSALLGAGQFMVGGAASPIVGLGGEATALPMALVITALAAVSFTFAFLNRWALGKEGEDGSASH